MMNIFKNFIEQMELKDLEDINFFKICKSFSQDLFTKELDVSVPDDLCLPFKFCLVSFKKSYFLKNIVKEHISYTADCVYFEESNPSTVGAVVLVRKFDGYSEQYFPIQLGYVNGEITLNEKFYSFLDNQTSRELILSLRLLLKDVLLELCTRKYVYVENTEKIDVKFRDKTTRKLNRVKYRPKMIIYISDKKTFKNEHPELSGRIISKPSFAYECMGHWRRLHNQDSLGKNREGEYLVEGFTWVIPHVRCADRGEVVKKIRVIR